MSEPTPLEVIADVLRAEGEIHSWKCDYPRMYGPCTCPAVLAGIIVEALIKAGAVTSHV